MKREVDRFIGGPSSLEPDGSSEVYLIVTDERPGVVSTGWRYLGLAMVLAATAAAALVTTVGSGRRSRSPPATTPPARSLCVRTRGYGGLGARVSDFDANNDNSTSPAGPSPGPAFYTVTATARGCVTAFAVQDFTGPPVTAGELLFLVSHPYLPADAKELVSKRACAVWKSAALKRATGRTYAEATASPQVGAVPGRAKIEASSRPRC